MSRTPVEEIMKKLVKLHKRQGTCNHVSNMEHKQLGLEMVVTPFVAHMVEIYGLTVMITPEDEIIAHKLIMQK